MIWENSIETCIISYKNNEWPSPGSMQDTGCLGTTQDLLSFETVMNLFHGLDFRQCLCIHSWSSSGLVNFML